MKKALIVTTGLKGTGIVDEINQILTTNGVATEIYDKVTSNPKDYQIMEAYDAFKEAGCDGVVSVGGGSSHDCGKGVRALAANDGKNIGDFAAFIDPPWMNEIQKYKPVTIPQIAVNTTAGTGAENSPVGVFSDTKRRAKLLFILPGLSPTALVDPLLVRLMPQNIAAQTGFDALTHGFEAFISRMQVPTSAGITIRLMKIVAENLREFTYNRMNDKACEMMCWAESMGILCLVFGGGAGIVHGFGHQIGALTDCHHGLANAILTPTLERYNEPSCPEKFAEMAGAMGVDTRGMTKMQAADKWFDEIERLLKDLNIKSGHLNEQTGLKKEDIPHIVDVYSNDWCYEGNPTAFNREECIQLLESML
ncbi:Methanol:N,N-dimethyl-4-nitrosoaniline oxidoreductase [subsurface metagenome]